MRSTVLLFAAALAACPAVDGPPDAGTLKDLFERCAANDECASGLCLGRGGCSPNECVDGCPIDEVCSVSNQAGNTCTPPRLRGERCSFADDVGAREETPCREDLVCEVISGGFTAEGLCVPPTDDRLLGEPCDLDNASAPCAATLSCIGTGVCRLNAGEACTDDNECASGQCGPESTCLGPACGSPGALPDTTDVCIGGDCGTEAGAAATLGEPCIFVIGECGVFHPCALGLSCPLDGATNFAVCEAP